MCNLALLALFAAAVCALLCITDGVITVLLYVVFRLRGGSASFRAYRQYLG